jgi:hypothetical protein
MAGHAREEAVFVDQGVIDAPGVDGDAGELDAAVHGFFEADLEFIEEAEEVPEETAVDCDAAIFESDAVLSG